MQIKVKRKHKIKIKSILFILLILVYSITTSDTETSKTSLPKYIIQILCILHSMYLFYRSGRNKTEAYFKKEFKGLVLFVVIIVVYSIFRSLLVSHFSFRTIQEIVFLLSPMLYAYYVINTWTKSEIEGAMHCGLLISFFYYILSLGMDFKEIYTALISSNFGDSYSEIESFVFCGFALAFCVYFCYYNSNKAYTVLSVIYVFMTFKRLFIVMAIIMLAISLLKVRDIKVASKWIWFTISALFIFAIIYYNVLLPENVKILESRYHLDISELTTTRSDRLRWLINSSYQTYGFGSSTEYMYDHFGGALEMDAIKIIVELGYVPLFAMIVSYIKSARANFYVFVFMTLELFNLIFSSGLTGSFAWSIIFISIASISIYPEENKRRTKYG